MGHAVVNNIRKKWRPSIAMVIAAVCVILISIPLLAMLSVRLTSNQFVRETEQSLIQQGAIYAQIYAREFRREDGPLVGVELTEDQKEHWNANLHPARSQLNVRQDDIAPPRPDGDVIATPPDPRHLTVAENLVSIARGARKTTLAGMVLLDHQGRNLNTETARSLAALPEVQTALNGEVGAILRARTQDYERHAFSSLSRDTGFRVFVTYPVIVDDRVIGAIYLSRTPLNLGKFLFGERYALLTMLIATVLSATFVGLLLLRLISRPVYALRDRSRAIAAGKNPNADPLQHYGLRELADLGDSVSTMAMTLMRRSKEIATYTDHVTHELKSPVTSVIGAAELLQSDGLKAQDRDTLLQNIETESQRMNHLLGRLREMTRLRGSLEGDPGKLAGMLPNIDGLKVVTRADPEVILPISEEHGAMILLHMGQNALSHGASELELSYADRILHVSDNGEGIADGDIPRVTNPFFTTRREQGGTGMGLAIVSAILENYGATITCLPCSTGASFAIHFSNQS